ncbi:MAG: hypothetical protein ABW199_12595 [Caulobacterales bacterium]
MSLNKTLKRLFDEVRREAKNNPDFANRLDAIIQSHASRRNVPDDVFDAIAAEEPLDEEAPAAESAPEINPVGVFQRAGEDGLKAALNDNGLSVIALRALIAEHNLDPGGEAAEFDRAGLVAHIVTSAQKRAERDRKLFDY